MNLAELLYRARYSYATKPVIIWNDEPIGFDWLEDRVHRFAAVLRERQVLPGDRVVLLAGNRPEWIVSFFAALSVGAVVVPVNSALADREVGFIVKHCEPRIVVADAKRSVAVDEDVSYDLIKLGSAETESQWHDLVTAATPVSTLVPRHNDDLAVIFYTSGTTGSPKGVALSHGAQIFSTNVVLSHFHITSDDVSLICAPLPFIFHISLNFAASVSVGATVVLQARFHPELAVRGIERHKVSVVMGVPTMYIMMQDWAEKNPADTSSLRLCVAGGASLPASLLPKFKARFGVALLEQWGLTECTPVACYDPLIDADGRPKSCGPMMSWCHTRIVDDEGRDVEAGVVGELLCKSDAMMSGYYRNPEATEAAMKDGWMCSGDLAQFDEDGYLYIVGRKKDLIIRGGANIYPSDIESILYRHPDILECAVIGVPDDLFGEIVKAVVVGKPSHTVDAERIRNYCAEHLADYKVPALVEIIAELPKGPTGKILKRVLRESQVADGSH